MMKRVLKIKLELILRFLFIVLFLYAAISKLIDYRKFYNDLLNSPIFGYSFLARFVSIIIPMLEIGISGLLISGKYLKSGWYLVFLLMLIFSIYIGGILVFSDNLPCSCGGIISELSWRGHLLFNICLTLLSGLGIYLNSKNEYKILLRDDAGEAENLTG
ncbi:hypothetical protein INR75_02120 [Zunongwangia sp. SCSIO 43204]|nr:hypothetical protein INR75_02120 [Zunongwangia sp. SCSIO 43204]